MNIKTLSIAAATGLCLLLNPLGPCAVAQDASHTAEHLEGMNMLRGRIGSPPRSAPIEVTEQSAIAIDRSRREHTLSSIRLMDPPEMITSEEMPTDLDGLLFHDLNNFVEEIYRDRN